MPRILSWGVLIIAGALFCCDNTVAADTTKGSDQGQSGAVVDGAVAGSRPPASGGQSHGAPSVGGGAAAREPAQGAQARPPSDRAGSAGQRPKIAVTPDNRISGDIEGRPLNEALQAMVEKKLFDVKGPLPAGEEIFAHFSGLTLDEVLKILMRGYNYVLMDQGTSQKPLLIVMGKIQRSPSSAGTTLTVQPPPPAIQPPGQNEPLPPPPGNRKLQQGVPGSPRTVPQSAAAASAAATPNAGPAGPEGAQASGPVQAGVPAGEAPQVAGGAPGQGQIPPQPGQAQVAPQPGQVQQQRQPVQGQPPQEGTSGSSSPDQLTSPFPKGETTGPSF